MEKFFSSKYTYSVESPQIAGEIKEARDKLNNMINSVYSNKVDELPDGFVSIENHRWSVNREDPVYQQWKIASRKAEEQELEDMKEAFKIMAEKSQGW